MWDSLNYDCLLIRDQVVYVCYMHIYRYIRIYASKYSFHAYL